MYLKAIKAQGFKSFADKLDIEIKPGITGIVGPNGSGKSNIVDAVRWVLGEQSLKSLRGTSMGDVIFAGSKSRDAQKRAMVSLIFDNSDHYLHSEFSEIEIKRVVYSTLENEYYINNSRVRLKDIIDLFIDCGAGAQAFNIISQGNVTDIVNSKSSDRRVIFESAAGVLKYKKRKEESLKKLEKTEENLLRIKLVIEELVSTIKPLAHESEEAKKYVSIKNELEQIDIALIVQDITNINREYNTLKREIDTLKDKLDSSQINETDAKIERLKLKSLDLDEKINQKRNTLSAVEAELTEQEAKKQLTIERRKYEVNQEKIDESLMHLKEEELALEKNIDILTREVSDTQNTLKDFRLSNEDIKNKILILKVKKSTLNNNLQEQQKQALIHQNRIDILENNILNADMAPSAVRSILGNPRLRGIHATIGKLIEVKDEYLTALNVALGASSNYIVVDNEDNAVDAINYLKEKHLGRATFYPLNIIKGRFIEESIINDIKNIRGYLGVFSSLVTTDKMYQNIIDNILGNIIVVNNATTLNVIGKLINYKYRVVSLDGEILHAGGSITGGTTQKNNMLNEKSELNKQKDNLELLKGEITTLSAELNTLDKEIASLEEQEIITSKNIIITNEELNHKQENLSKLTKEHEEKQDELESIDNLKNQKLDDQLMEILENINAISKKREMDKQDLEKLILLKEEVSNELKEEEQASKQANLLYREVANNLKEKEVQFGKLEVNLDNLLLTLNNDYNKTYEYASLNYSLDMDTTVARAKVKDLKEELNRLGNVNVGAIAEYERLNTRYTFLNEQKEDLISASSELKNIIGQMDEIMVSKFQDTFEKIKKEFKRIFKQMFKGGEGDLKLSNPEDILNTGIDIIAIPPGKKINSPMSLSGGEKALTAIVLLFAMLEVRPSPFVILDEAEAALDEVNVDMFGKYLNQEKEKCQFIVITHKKRMMEYADCLYGITMQESGVSKVVSAKLENA